MRLNLPGDLDLRLEREIDRDRRYEARRPDRQHWVRRLGKAEAQVNEIVAGSSVPAGMRGYVAVRKIAPGVRVRAFFFASTHFDVDLSEGMAASLWAHVSGARP